MPSVRFVGGKGTFTTVGRWARCVQPRTHVYEREVLSTTAYMCGSDEPHLKEVVQHQQYMSRRGRHSLLSNSVAIIEKYQLDITVGERSVERQGEVLSPKAASKLLSAAKNDHLKTTLEKKKIHGVFYSQCQMQAWDTNTVGSQTEDYSAEPKG